MCENCVKNQWRENGDSPFLIRPRSIYMLFYYNARLDKHGRAGVKSAPFGPLVEGLKLIGYVDVVTDNIIECIASLTLKGCVVAMID